MNTATEGLLVIAAFSLAHERVIELLRWMVDSLTKLGVLPSKGTVATALNDLTAGPLAIVPGIALALATNANMLDAFGMSSDGTLLFFKGYLSGYPTTTHDIIGCALMGCSVALGSKFWHDLAMGLVDVRSRLKITPPDGGALQKQPGGG